MYGDVPLVTKPLTSVEALEVSRSPRNEVVAYILEEFEGAASGLGSTLFNGSATRQAALGMRAKTMLYEARLGNMSYADALSELSNALSVSEGAGQGLVSIADPTINLLEAIDDYVALFDGRNENNEEVLLQ